MGLAMVLTGWSFGGMTSADEPARESRPAEVHEIRLALNNDGSVEVRYNLARPTGRLALRLPEWARGHWRPVAPQDAIIQANGTLVVSVPQRNFQVELGQDAVRTPPGSGYPLTFAVEHRGTSVFLPFLLLDDRHGGVPVSVVIQGGEGIAAVADGQYREIPEEYEVASRDGYVIVGRNLLKGSIVQTPANLPAWLEVAVRQSHEYAQHSLTTLLGRSRESVTLLVGYPKERTHGVAWGGGDAAGQQCGVRLWLQGDGWEKESAELRSMVNDVIAHEVVHCYQETPLWQEWAHEGHARFLEVMLSSRLSGEYSPGSVAEARFVADFDRCMSDLRTGEREIKPYACGGVIYWLRWLETGRMTMIAAADLAEAFAVGHVTGRFIERSATASGIVQFVRQKGVRVVTDDVHESPASVRLRLAIALLRHNCGQETSFGFWTNETSITLDAEACSELDGLEVQTIAGHDIIDDVYAAYEAAAQTCRVEGYVTVRHIEGNNDALSRFACDQAYRWPPTMRLRYRLVSPFA